MDVESMDNEMKMVSIIVPVYNTPAQFLRECIESIYTQTYPKIQMIIVDDGSVQECAKLCDTLCSDAINCGRIGEVELIHQNNGGVSVARNKGIERVRGEYVCFVDADDLLHKDYVSVLVDAIEAQGAEMAACSFKEIRTPEQLKKCKDDVVNIGKSNLAKGVEIYYRTAGYVWNHIFRRSILKNIRFDTEFRTHQDGLFMDEMILKLGECAYTDETAYYYRINASSATKKVDSEKYKRALFVVNKQTQNKYVRQDRTLLSRRIAVREKYRIKYMVALTQEKPTDWKEIIKLNRKDLATEEAETYAGKGLFLRISQKMLKLPFPITVLYLRILYFMQCMVIWLKSKKWKQKEW